MLLITSAKNRARLTLRASYLTLIIVSAQTFFMVMFINGKMKGVNMFRIDINSIKLISVNENGITAIELINGDFIYVSEDIQITVEKNQITLNN